MPGAARAVRRLRDRGAPLGVASNQSGIGRGLITRAQVDAVNDRVADLLGPIDVWEICPHVAADGCTCRKPRPGMLLRVAERLGVDPAGMVFIGDIGADMAAARAAGARAILVPTAITLPAEVAAAEAVAPDITTAVAMCLGEVAWGQPEPSTGGQPCISPPAGTGSAQPAPAAGLGGAR